MYIYSYNCGGYCYPASCMYYTTGYPPAAALANYLRAARYSRCYPYYRSCWPIGSYYAYAGYNGYWGFGTYWA